MPGFRRLSPLEEKVLVHGATEEPFTGRYVNEFSPGTYFCRRCGQPLYSSDEKLHSGCGWPSFNSESEGAVRARPEPDGRTEISCSKCGGHLGHVFPDDEFPSGIRHCVNSASLLFVPSERLERAVFAGGCFWGMQYMFREIEGVIHTTAGYAGPDNDAPPTYEDVSLGNGDYVEAVEVLFDGSVVSYEELARFFFEIHDPTTVDRQGPDVGKQYRSAVFYVKDSQRETAMALVDILRKRGYDVVTEIKPLESFHPAEDHHQDYYLRNGAGTICHTRVNRFSD